MTTGPALARLLSGPAGGERPASRQTFSDRLSQWVGWTDAIALSAALHGGGAAAAPAATPPCAPDEAAQCARVRSALEAAIAQDARSAAQEAATDFAPHRRRYQARQQAMAASIGPLRERVRDALAGRSPALARLAAVDAVMEQALGGHEQRLLAKVPQLLEKKFQGARQDGPAAFGPLLHSVLMAELDIRMQPVEGLLEALRAG